MSETFTKLKFLLVTRSATRRSVFSNFVTQQCPDAEVLQAENCESALQLAHQHGTDLQEVLLELANSRYDRNRVNRFLASQESKYELENDTSLVAPLIACLLEQALSLKLLKEADLNHLNVALTESLTNAINHGNLELDSELRQEDESVYYDLAETRRVQWPYCDRRVFVLASYSRERVKFVIRDEGPGFNVKQVADPTDAEHVCRIGGRGLLLIRAFMDEVFHNDRGNEITLVKYVVPGAALLAKMTEPPANHAELQASFVSHR